jgi:hypothetical protein
MASLEDFAAGPLDEPAGLGEGYTLERQFQNGRAFQSFDRVTYFPDPNGERGYVRYEGIVNGWSDYDGKWFRATAKGDAAMRRIIAGTMAQPYLLLTNTDGEFMFLDPTTLAEIAAVRVADEWGYLTVAQVALDGAQVRYNHSGAGNYELDLAAQTDCRLAESVDFRIDTLDGHAYWHTPGTARLEMRSSPDAAPVTLLTLPGDVAQFIAAADRERIMGFAASENSLTLTLIDLSAFPPYVDSSTFALEMAQRAGYWRGAWRGAWNGFASFAEFYLTDGLNLLRVTQLYPPDMTAVALDYEGRAAVEAGTTWVEILGAHDGTLYLYHPLGDFWIYDYAAEDRGDIQRGIFAINTKTGKQVARWQPDLAISAAAQSDDSFYVIQAPRGAETAQVIRLDARTGEVLATKDLSSTAAWRVTFDYFAPDAVLALGASDAPLACPHAEPEAEPVAIVAPVTATPKP